MQLDKRNYGLNRPDAGGQYFMYKQWQKDLNPRIEERGYCPIKNGQALGRYKFHSVAEMVPCDLIVAYRDLDRFGYAESDRNWLQEMIKKRSSR